MVDLCFEELADLLLGDDCWPNPSSTAAFYPESGDINDIDLVNGFISPPLSYNDEESNDITIDDESVKSINNIVQEQLGQSKKKRKEETEKKKAVVSSEEGGKKRRKRHPDQVQDHIVAERKRREVLSHMFISLSSLIPGLKKMDKTTILGEAIKHMKELKEKVKDLEVEAAQLNATNKSVVVIKKYQLPMDDDDDDDNDDGSSSSTLVNDISGSGGSDGSGGTTNNNNLKKCSLLPEIEVKISDNNLLLKVNCEKREGILSELTAAMDGHDLSITSCVVMTFDNLILDITIVAQMRVGFNINMKCLARTLRSTLRSTSP